MMTDITVARADMREAFLSGATGIFVSGLAWAAAAICTYLYGAEVGMKALFAGGVLIFPISVLLSKLLGVRGTQAKDNPLGPLAMATTFWLIFSLPIAYVVFLQNADWFFPAMLLIIGGRYLTFGAIYGMRLYWGLGLALAAAGFGLVSTGQVPLIAAAAGAVIELVFAAVCFALHAKWRRN